MKAKKVLYSILLALFALILAADVAVFLLVPVSAQADGTETETAQERPSFSDGERPSFPDGSGFSVPDFSGDFSGFSVPDFSGGERPSFPDGSSGFTLPDEESAEATDGGTLLSTLSQKLQAFLPDWLWNALTFLRPYRLWILIGAAAGIVLCIVRLIFLAVKSRKLKAAQAASAEDDPLPSRKKVAVWPAILLLLAALVLVALLFPADTTETTAEAVAQLEVVFASAARGTISESLIAAGYLEEQEAEAVTLPASVEIAAVCVQNGESVTEGQVIAKVNRTSVMVAISNVEEAIAQIDGQLQDAHDAVGSTTLKAPVSGTVKQIYAQVGDDAADVMAEYGSLLLLSLDGRMSVEIPASEGLSADSALLVTLSDGTVVSGEITDRSEDSVTVSVADRNYPIGETVSVSDENGTLYGSGTLSVHRPLNVTQYLGMVTRIYRDEGASVTAGTILIGLSDAEDTANYRTLLSQRAAYEAELKTLFELYQYEVILAPTDGVVSGISEEIPYREASALLGDEAVVRFVSTSPQDAAPSDYVHYVGQVTENNGGTLSLNISMNAVEITDYTDISTLSEADMSLSGTYTVPASVPVYTYTDGLWSTIPSFEIAAGDLAIFTFDENGTLVWVIDYAGAAPTPAPEPTPEPTPEPAQEPATESTSGAGFDPDSVSGGSQSGGSVSVPSSGSFGMPSVSGGADAAKEPAYRIAEQTLLSVTPQETMTLSTAIDELDVLSISVGQRVSVYLDAFSGTYFEGTVTGVDPEGTNDGGNTKYTVTVAIARTESRRAGMNGTVVLSGSTHEDALLIPLAALCENGSTVTVYTGYDPETDTLLNPVPVETGVSDGTNVQILSGLTEGELYCYRYADSVSYATGA